MSAEQSGATVGGTTAAAGSQSPATAPAVTGWQGPYVDAMYEQWLEAPNSVDAEWRTFFQGFDLGVRSAPDDEGDDGTPTGARPSMVRVGLGQTAHSTQGRVDSLVYHYRDIGHLRADLDPLGRPRPGTPHLELDSFGLGEADLGETFDPGHLPLPAPSSLRDIIARLDETYCRHIGVEYMHIQDRERRRWLQSQMEPVGNRPAFTSDEKLRILRELIEADGFENFLGTRYRGKKRFGLDGGESLIAMLDELAENGPANGVREYTIAMAHRGRLNVLVNILHKTYDKIFTEFEEAWTEDFLEGGGDVKYHQGYSGDFPTESGDPIRITLSPNPSHLEFANSVVLGRARAKQRLRHDDDRTQCVPILIHGDAAFPGQGITAECLNMMKLDGYTVGGAIHFVINNQIGFTTNPADAHSGTYCTDLAKMVEAPIFHVNGDDPEACVWVTRMAMAYRQLFGTDVIIDMWCFRKFGHNEGDEPAFTQPLMYELIRKHTPVMKLYADRLMNEGVITQAELDTLAESVRSRLDEAQTRVKDQPVSPGVEAFGNVWSGLTDDYSDAPVETGVDRDTLARVAECLGGVPEDFDLHKKLGRQLKKRRDAILEEQPFDWGTGEMLAYGTLLLDGNAVRLTGQDVERGTFSHRHAVLFDQTNGQPYINLNHLADDDARDQAKFCIHNSPLTESACLGFEYGYSLGDPNMLVIWEAQFGDFANGAQVIFDQFISSAEQKWGRFSGLTCFLPHGYEGQGPEHSSARIERFLQLCAKDNMQVAYPTTPAQQFHLLRRQMKRNFRKPLIVMTPKSLLRHPKATSTLTDLTDGRFYRMIDDAAIGKPDTVRRLLFCSGKVYYDLVDHRDKAGADDVAIVRLEQLFPFAEDTMREILARYPKAEQRLWVQEEPRNMGAWSFVDETMRDRFDISLKYVGRDRNASPAVGSMKMHQQEQQRIMVNAIGIAADG
ncbi:MAG: 2-oxoglutarate dehydrogenase E1 component [Phycisphaerales bacterium]